MWDDARAKLCHQDVTGATHPAGSRRVAWRAAGNRFACASVLLLLATPGSVRANALDHLRTTDDIGLNKIPHFGRSHILVIPMRVGEAAFPAGTLRDLRATFDPDGGPSSFRAYWQAVSRGAYDPVPVLVDPVLYPDSCPIPGRSVANCTISISDWPLLLNRGVAAALADILTRVRDEQGIDLSQFDVNGAAGPGPDGYFDGVIIDSNIYSGVAPPLAALGNEVHVTAAPLGGGPSLTMGIVAMVPPVHHEFAHQFGFIDLYGGPPVNGLMEDTDATLEAFSRIRVGWADVVMAQAPFETGLAPVLDSGTVLQIGAPPRYLLIENRAGARHELYDESEPGIYVYSIDEGELPTTPLGFLDGSSLYKPNAEQPYLDVVVPVGCRPARGAVSSPCALTQDGEERALVHASGAQTGLRIRVGAASGDGTVPVAIFREDEPKPTPPDGGVTEDPSDADSIDAASQSNTDLARSSSDDGCQVTGSAAGSSVSAVALAWLLARRRRRRRADAEP